MSKNNKTLKHGVTMKDLKKGIKKKVGFHYVDPSKIAEFNKKKRNDNMAVDSAIVIGGKRKRRYKKKSKRTKKRKGRKTKKRKSRKKRKRKTRRR